MLQNPIKGIINELYVNSLTCIDATDSDINGTASWVDHDSTNSLDNILALNRLFNIGADYVRPVFHECAETRAETQKMMCLLRIYFCSRKRVHGNDPYYLFRFEFSAR